MKIFVSNHRDTYLGCVLLTILMSLSTLAFANKSDAPLSIFDKMYSQEVLDITLEVDYTAITENRFSKDDYTATLSFTDITGEQQVWNTEVNLRGKYRRTKCAEMPPLKLKFKKGDLEKVGLSAFNDMKLVTHCVEDQEEAKDLILKEYLAYKLYNVITDESFRVQLVNVTYKDINTGKENVQSAFLIEDTSQLRARLEAQKKHDYFNTKVEQFDAEQFKTMAVFQYMIGNSDWNTLMAKNIKVLKTNDELMAIPYDFDFSGLVNAPYAKANKDYHLTSTKDRVYLGFEEHMNDLDATYQHFLDKRRALIQTVVNFDELSLDSRREIIHYLESFFDEGPNFKTKESYLQKNK